MWACREGGCDSGQREVADQCQTPLAEFRGQSRHPPALPSGDGTPAGGRGLLSLLQGTFSWFSDMHVCLAGYRGLQVVLYLKVSLSCGLRKHVNGDMDPQVSCTPIVPDYEANGV